MRTAALFLRVGLCCFALFQTKGASDLGDKRRSKFALAAAFYIEKSDDRENHCSNEIHHQVFHGINQTNIHISSRKFHPVLSIDHQTGDGFMHNNIQPRWIQQYGIDILHQKVFLHIHM